MTSGDVGPHSAIKRGRRNICKNATHIYSLLYIPYISLGLYIMIRQDRVNKDSAIQSPIYGFKSYAKLAFK